MVMMDESKPLQAVSNAKFQSGFWSFDFVTLSIAYKSIAETRFRSVMACPDSRFVAKPDIKFLIVPT
jgi:hypothetical protein